MLDTQPDQSSGSYEVSPLTARKTWRTLEPLHGMIYFALEAKDAYSAVGVEGKAGYFASRAASLGVVSAEVVAASFYTFDPALVSQSIPAVWDVTSPEDMLEARLHAADGALKRMLGSVLESSTMIRISELVRAAAMRAAERPAGRVLFAGHAGLRWPAAPHLSAWHGQSCLREFRGDGHFATLLLAEIGPVEALVMHVATGEVPLSFVRGSRGWSDTQWADAVDSLRRKGWLEPPSGSRPGQSNQLTLSGSGKEARQRVEDETDRLAVFPYEALGEGGCAELRALARPLSQAIAGSGGLGFPPT